MLVVALSGWPLAYVEASLIAMSYNDLDRNVTTYQSSSISTIETVECDGRFRVGLGRSCVRPDLRTCDGPWCNGSLWSCCPCGAKDCSTREHDCGLQLISKRGCGSSVVVKRVNAADCFGNEFTSSISRERASCSSLVALVDLSSFRPTSISNAEDKISSLARCYLLGNLQSARKTSSG